MSEQTFAPYIPCARGCNGRDILGHTAYCWRQRAIALEHENERLRGLHADAPRLTGLEALAYQGDEPSPAGAAEREGASS